jgi:hypothetical protein
MLQVRATVSCWIWLSIPPYIFISLSFFLMNWSLNSVVHTCRAGTLPLVPHIQSIFSLVILEMVSHKLFAETGLKPWFSQYQPLKYLELQVCATGAWHGFRLLSNPGTIKNLRALCDGLNAFFIVRWTWIFRIRSGILWFCSWMSLKSPYAKSWFAKLCCYWDVMEPLADGFMWKDVRSPGFYSCSEYWDFDFFLSVFAFWLSW